MVDISEDDFTDDFDDASDNDFSDDIEDISEDDFADDIDDVSDDDFSDDTVDISEDDFTDDFDDASDDDFSDDIDDISEDDFTDDLNEASDNIENISEDNISNNLEDIPEDEFANDATSDELVDNAENISDEISEDESFDDNINDSNNYIDDCSLETETENTDVNYVDDYPNDTSMGNDELADFTDFENAYASEIDDIRNDQSLSDFEKSDLLQSSYNEFVESNGINNYSDADIEDPSYAKVLTENSDMFNRTDNQDYVSSDTPADISHINDLDNWLCDINPNFDEFDINSPYCNNCGSCAYAVWRRLEGDSDICASAENIGYNEEMEALTGMEQVSMSPDEIENNLLTQGDGAHAIIGIDRAEGPGHWFNAACIDGKVVAIDGQSGEILDWPPDYGDVVNWEMSVKKG